MLLLLDKKCFTLLPNNRRQGLFSTIGLPQRLNVDFFHSQHCIHDPARFPGILVQKQLAQGERNNLPG
jgi:hypothetical protein